MNGWKHAGKIMLEKSLRVILKIAKRDKSLCKKKRIFEKHLIIPVIRDFIYYISKLCSTTNVSMARRHAAPVVSCKEDPVSEFIEERPGGNIVTHCTLYPRPVAPVSPG